VPRQRGFSFIELVVAMAILVAVTGAVFALVHPANREFDAKLEIADQQQRVRVAADTLTRDLTMAGAGAYIDGHVGPLIHYFAPVMPFQWRTSGGDPPGTFRTDAITLVSVPSTAAQTRLAADLTASEPTLRAVPGSSCPAGTNLCGFAPGMTVLVFDDTGSAGLFTIAAVEDAVAEMTLTAWPAGSETTIYRRGANVVEASVNVYYLKTDVASQTYQLMHSDGSSNPDVPVLDHVVGLSFQYDGEPRAPILTPAGDTSYGPAPPESSTRPTAYPAGENCAFRIDEASGLPAPRLPALAAGTALTPLAAATLTDGPWCPDEANANRWDADLLRIRKIGVTVRIEAAQAALRGPASALFRNGGSSRDVNRWVPDQEVRFQVSPRNMNLDRE
jgi:prepilin-type N-terminal cleavage/methylation domain-containing protein